MLEIAEEKLLTYHQRASFSRVFLGCCIGFLLGNRFLPLYLRQNQHEVAHNPCIEDEIMLQKWRELNSDFYKLKKQFSVIHQKSAFYIGELTMFDLLLLLLDLQDERFCVMIFSHKINR